MSPRQPKSTLFPYTTLFRSDSAMGVYWEPKEIKPGTVKKFAYAYGQGIAPSPEDRKSTRLNSSHVSISYAVFCLKKKKPQTRSASNTPYTCPASARPPLTHN